jgi:hypothetical protein
VLTQLFDLYWQTIPLHSVEDIVEYANLTHQQHYLKFSL